MKTHALFLATGSALFLTLSSIASAACDPTVAQSPTRFPLQSQLRGQQGTVYLEVTVDASGRVSNPKVLQSSGYRLLDRAAIESIRDEWVFNVATCERKDLPASDLVAIEYRNDEYAD